MKGVMNLLCAVSVTLACIMAVLIEALFIVLLCADNLCRGAQNGVNDILDAVPGYNGNDDPLDDVCDVIGGARQGAFDLWVGSMCLVVGQFIVSLYWMKYSTLALALPFYQDVQVIHRQKKGTKPRGAGNNSKKVHPQVLTNAVAVDVVADVGTPPTESKASENDKSTIPTEAVVVPVGFQQSPPPDGMDAQEEKSREGSPPRGADGSHSAAVEPGASTQPTDTETANAPTQGKADNGAPTNPLTEESSSAPESSTAHPSSGPAPSGGAEDSIVAQLSPESSFTDPPV